MSASRGKCSFNDMWLSNVHYKDWLLKTDDINNAKCRLCLKVFSVSNMGEAALKSHAGGAKHQAKMKSTCTSARITEFLPQQKPSVKENSTAITSLNSVHNNSNNCVVETSDSGTVKDFLSGHDVLDAEILWTLKTVKSHFSYNSNQDIAQIFRRMFPDSRIAAYFSCGEQKTKYISVFGIAPWIKTKLIDSVNNSDVFVFLFDETYNRSLKKKQLDVHVRYWSRANKIKTVYLNSVYLGHATAEDLLEKFFEAIIPLKIKHALQISMDGPNVNWKFYNLISEKLREQYNSEILNIGSCGLHTVHNAFKSGNVATDWNIDGLLSSIYNLFKDSPARLEDLQNSMEGEKSSPFKFVRHRWLENIPAAERALKLLPALKKYVKGVSEKKFEKPSCNSFRQVSIALKDKLLEVKLHMFISTAKILFPFLSKYQTDKPMLIFMAEDLKNVIRTLMKRFVKPTVLESATTMLKMINIEYNKIENQRELDNVDPGFSSSKLLGNLILKKKISEKDRFNFLSDCRKCYSAIVSKIVTKSPISYSLVRHLSCLDPRNMVKDNKASCLKKLKLILYTLSELKIVSDTECEDILLQFDDYFSSIVYKNYLKFSNYNPYDNDYSIDEFYHESMTKTQYEKLWKVVRKLLLLSHGQASVERGFSINKKIETENLIEGSYVALRLITEWLDENDWNSIQITKDLRLAVASARKKYSMYLEDKKQEELNKVREKKKSESEQQGVILKKRKLELLEEIEMLAKSADDLAEDAANKRDISLIIKSNSFRQSIKKNKEELKHLEKQILHCEMDF